ncbi:MAG: hypothetical protein AAF573_07920 [Bacteroidota bacterium]
MAAAIFGFRELLLKLFIATVIEIDIELLAIEIVIELLLLTLSYCH